MNDKQTSRDVVLGRWYARHSTIRFLQAVRQPNGIQVTVALEPSFDADDIYPVWISNGLAWAEELQHELGETVMLGVLDEHRAVPEAPGGADIVVAELFWRDTTQPWPEKEDAK